MTSNVVVVVDDEDIIIRPVARLLRSVVKEVQFEYDVLTSRSPEEVLSEIEDRNQPVALVISDLMMQPMNGLEFLQQIKSRFPECLLVVLTGYADQKTFRLLTEELELYSYHEKPWDHHEFKRTLRNALTLFQRKQLLGRYVPEEIVEQVLIDAHSEVLQGIRLEVSILFLDIRNSTKMLASDQEGGHAILSHLNQYFEQLVKVVHQYDGVLDKFMGDGIMALFGVPYPTEDAAKDAQNAVLAALEMRHKIHKLNETIGKDLPLKIGVGISTGWVIAGNIGTQRRANYTVLGHDVNIASRLEKAAKPIEDGILISARTYDYARELIEAEVHEASIDDGHGEMLTVYEVKGRE